MPLARLYSRGSQIEWPNRRSHRKPFCTVVQRQRNSGTLLDSSRDRRNYHLTPCLAPLAPFRNDIHVISGLDNFAAGLPGPAIGPSQLDERLDDLHSVHRTGRRRPSHRSGDRRQDRRRFPVPLSATRRRAGILWRKHPTQHELGRASIARCLLKCCPTVCSIGCSAAREEGWINRKRSILDAVHGRRQPR